MEFHIEKMLQARSLISEAAAINELASRVQGNNEEVFDMLQRASEVSLRLLEDAGKLLAD